MSNTKDVRMKNSLKILREFMSGGFYTKNEISDKVSLTLVTTSKIVNKLYMNGVIIEQGIADSECGRKASMYTLNAEKFYICGLAIELDFFHVEILNLKKEAVYAKAEPLDSTQPFETSMCQISEYIAGVFEQLQIKNENLLGIGVTVPGIVDSQKGETVVLPNMPSWNHAPIKKFLEKRFHTLVIVEKDNYAAILYLKAVSTQKMENAVLLTILGGVGCGILIGGKIYRGENGLAGEIGHVDFGRDPGESDILEKRVSDFSIVNEIQYRREKKGLPPLVENKKMSIGDAINGFKSGDAICREVFQEATEYVGNALAILVKLYDPKQIFIDSVWIREVPKVFSSLNSRLKQINGLLPNTSVKLINIKNSDTIMKGASMLIYDYVTNHSTGNKLIG